MTINVRVDYTNVCAELYLVRDISFIIIHNILSTT